MGRYSDALKKVKKRAPKSLKKRAFLWLHGPRFQAFKTLCEKDGQSASRIIDLWIEEALEEKKRR